MEYSSIRVLDQDCKLIKVVELKHTKSNIAKVAGQFVNQLGKILKTDSSSDCVSIVTFENGVLGFSI